MDQIFNQILNNAILASYLILIVILVRTLLKKAPKWIPCVLWAIVAIRLVCPISLESALSLIPNAKPIPETIAMEKTPQIESGISSVDFAVNPVLEQHFGVREDYAVSVNPMQLVLLFAQDVWLLGFAALGFYALLSYVSLRRKVAASLQIEKNVYECDEIESPFILGILRPRIYLSAGLKEEQKLCVIAHEKAHVERLDYVWKPFGFLILSLYWFNPLCWVAYYLLCKDIEYACDEKATSKKDDVFRANYC